MGKSKIFTNRHGKKVRVNDDTVSIPADSVTSQPPKVSYPKTQKRFRLKAPSFKPSKKIIAGLLIIIVVSGVAVVLTADSVKRDYERQTAAMTRSVIERSKQSFGDQTSGSQQIEALRNSLSAETSCRVSGIDVVSWYGPAKSAREACQSTAENYKKLQSSLGDLNEVAKYLERIADTIKPALALPAEGQFAVIPEYVESWQTARDELNQLETSVMLERSHNTLTEKTEAVAASWRDLFAANSAQDKTAFDAAEARLMTSYDEYRSATSDITVLIDSIQSSVSRYVELIIS